MPKPSTVSWTPGSSPLTLACHPEAFLSKDIQASLSLPITSLAVGDQTKFREPSNSKSPGQLVPPQRKDKVKELKQQEIMFLTTQTMEAKYKDMQTPQDQYSDQLGALAPLASTSTEPDL